MIPTLRRALTFLTAIALAGGGIAVLAPAAEAAAPVLRFTFIQYDSPGKDTRSNASLNKEYVRITNTGTVAVNIVGFTLLDTSRHRYVFPSHVIGKGKTVYVHTGRGVDGVNPFTGKADSSRLYWGSRAYVWTNPKDTATLRTATRIYDTCSWSKIGKGYTYC